MPHSVSAPTLQEFREAQKKIQPYIRVTPVAQMLGAVIDSLVGPQTQVFTKLEMLQFAGSFKARAAILKILESDEQQRKRGVVAVSAGNHAIAVSYAASQLSTSAKVVMPSSVSPIRIQKCESRGAEVVLVEDFAQAFMLAEEIATAEGRLLIHPFEGRSTACGTGTIGIELLEQISEPLDAVVVSVGGGGLAAGLSAAIKQLRPQCAVYGVEPSGAASICESIRLGHTVRLSHVDTIATSLAAPYSLPYSFGLCRQYLDDVVQVTDDDMCNAMALFFYEMKFALEPACAAVLAALIGPLRERLTGKRVALLLCGSSIDADLFAEYVKRGEAYYYSILRK